MGVKLSLSSVLPNSEPLPCSPFTFFYSARNPYAAQESQGQRKRPDHHGGQVFSSLQHWFSRVLFSNKLSPQAHQCVARATEKGRKKTFYV